MRRQQREIIVKNLLLTTAIFSLAAVLLITVFVFKEGMPALNHTGVFPFLFGQKWDPTNGVFGIWPMLVGSVYLTLGAIIIGVPFGVGCAVLLAEFAPRSLARIIRPAVELLAGIPSVIYGFFGLIVLVPLLRESFGGTGFSLLAGSLILGIMILPTVMTVSEDAIKAMPKTYKHASLALGATHWQTVYKVILPAAKSGIIAAVVLGMGRAIGETMAVIMITGNVPIVPNSILAPVRTLTGNIAIEMGYAAGLHQQALFATGIILFIFIFILTGLANIIRWKGAHH